MPTETLYTNTLETSNPDNPINNRTQNTPLEASLSIHYPTMCLMVAGIPGYAFCKDTQSRYLACNQAFADLVGLSDPAAITGKTDYELNWQVPGNGAPFFRQGDQATFDGHPINNQEEVLTLGNQPSRIVCVNKRPLYDAQGHVIGLLAVAQDITAQAQLKATLENAKADFLSSMAHDLRTPFVGIQGIIDLLAITPQADHPPLLNLLKEATSTLLSYLVQAIQYAGEQSYLAPVTNKPLSPDTLIGDVMSLLQPLATHKKLTLTRASAASGMTVMSDYSRLYAIILSLVSNALSFTDRGGVSILSELDCADGQNHAIWMIQVQDTGIGIEPCHQSRIFEPFTRVTPSYKTGSTGLGLGLSLVKKHCDALGGDISLDSTFGKGSTFTCRIPVMPVVPVVISS